jgi:hypothetical protein
MKIFKIRNKKTKLFSTGGRYADWNKKGKTWDSRENAQKAIDWHTRDEKSYYDETLREYKEDCDNVKKHNKKPYNIKSGNIWPMSDDKPSMRFTPFYKNSEIVEFGIKEV